jgi:hypothetical protein
VSSGDLIKECCPIRGASCVDRGVSSASMSVPRLTVEEILDQVRRLPEEERRRVVADLQAEPGPPPSEDCRRAAMRRWLARVGTGHAEVDDVSRNKNRYLAEIYATKP